MRKLIVLVAACLFAAVTTAGEARLPDVHAASAKVRKGADCKHPLLAYESLARSTGGNLSALRASYSHDPQPFNGQPFDITYHFRVQIKKRNVRLCKARYDFPVVLGGTEEHHWHRLHVPSSFPGGAQDVTIKASQWHTDPDTGDWQFPLVEVEAYGRYVR